MNAYWSWRQDEFSDRPEVAYLDEHLPWLMDCQRIVDLGCGVGHLVKRLRDSGKEAVGVTYNPCEVEAGAKLGIDLVLSDMQNLSFPDIQFDAMVMWDSLEHCPSMYDALCEARRVVKAGGKGLIFIPGQWWQEYRHHIIVPTQRQMQHLLKICEWELVEMVDLGGEVNVFGKQDEMAVYKVRRG